MATTKRKHIDLEEEIIKILEHEAVDMGSNFKNYVESLLSIISSYSDYNKSSIKNGASFNGKIELLEKITKSK